MLKQVTDLESSCFADTQTNNFALFEFQFQQTLYVWVSAKHELSKYENCFGFWIIKIWTYLKSVIKWSNMA